MYAENYGKIASPSFFLQTITMKTYQIQNTEFSELPRLQCIDEDGFFRMQSTLIVFLGFGIYSN